MPAATPEGRVFAALAARLATFGGDRPIAWPGAVYPPEGEDAAPEYLIVSHSPNAPLGVVIDSADENVLRGVFGVSVMTALGAGEEIPQTLAGQLADHFQGQVLTSGSTRVRVVSRPHAAGGYRDGDRWRTPVVVQYETTSV